MKGQCQGYCLYTLLNNSLVYSSVDYKFIDKMDQLFTYFKIFTSFGLFHSKYNTKTKKFIVNRTLVIYSVTFSIINYIYCGYFFFLSSQELNRELFGKNIQTLIFRKIIVFLDCNLNILMGVNAFFCILLNRYKLCKIMNQLIVSKNCHDVQNNHQKLIQFRNYFFQLAACIFSGPISYTLLMGFSAFGFIHAIFLSIQYFFGHLYEMILFEFLQIIFKNVSKNLKAHKSISINEQLSTFNETWKICQKLTKMFDINKIVSLLSFITLMAIYCFYSFDSAQKAYVNLIWMITLTPVIGVCFSWNNVVIVVS